MAVKVKRKRVTAAGSTNLTLVKGGSALLFGYRFTNHAASARYVKLYNKATAPVLAEDTPVEVISLPAGATIVVPPNKDLAVRHPLGLGYSIVNDAGDTGTTAATANDVIGVIWYI